MSVQAISGAVGSSEASPGVLAAGERVQQLQTLIAQVERGSAGFAAALDAAQTSSGTGASSKTGATVNADTTDTGLDDLQSQTYPASYAAATDADAMGLTSAYSTAALDAGDYTTDTSAAGGYADGTSGYATDASQYTTDTAGYATGAVDAGGEAATGAGAYAGLIDQAAVRNGVEPAVLDGLIEQESGFDPSATSSAGALGLTQLMPSTAASLGVSEPLDPAQSIEGGARYLGELMREFGGNVTDALAAYNAGPGAVEQYGGVPPYAETEQYVTKVLANADAFRQSGAGAGTASDVAAVSASDVGATGVGTGATSASIDSTDAVASMTPTSTATFASVGGTSA